MLNNIVLPCQDLYSNFLPTPDLPDELPPKQIYDLANFFYTQAPPEGYDLQLCRLSNRDLVWDTHRTQTMFVEQIYNAENEFEKYAQRMFECSGWLKFGFNENNGLVLKQANFCRVRYCPVCQWRKSLLWKALMYQSYPAIRAEHPKHRFIFLTLTIKNPHITELRSTLKHMNESWKRLINRKEFMAVCDGWIRTTEVARPKLPRENKKSKIVYCPKTKNTHAHPHFHIILMVKPSYFSHGYLKQSDWVRLWRECLNVDYDPVVDVRTVKPKKGGHVVDGMELEEAIKSSIAETLKYATKPDEILHDCENAESREWFYELTRQTHKLRFVASGGALKNAIKDEKKITNQEMIQTGNDDEVEQTDEKRLNFTFYRNKKKYVYNPNFNE